jgi:polysaccharide deacetylase family protein (PEP-CTERM system associated)
MHNSLTFDVEDYYQVGAFADKIPTKHWAFWPSRVEANTDRILEQITASGCQATFFVLGWVAESHPKLIRRIANLGHEVACHSAEHRPVNQMTISEFRTDTKRAKQAIEAASGLGVYGYRAPSFSIDKHTLWAFEILAELGFEYDSSIFPIEHPNYGMPNVLRSPFLVETHAGSIVEFPMTTLELGGRRAPMGGGAYLRLLPYWYTRWALRYINEIEARPFCVYLHPWEIDPEQPRVHGDYSARLRHYLGLRGAQAKLSKLLLDFKFCPLRTLVSEHYASSTAHPSMKVDNKT